MHFKIFQVLPSRITRVNRIAWREMLLLIFIFICILGIYYYTPETTNVSKLLLLLLSSRLLNP
jgi:hypothetical protein